MRINSLLKFSIFEGDYMSILKSALIVLLFSSTVAVSAPASENSIKELMSVTQMQKLLDGVRAQVDSEFNNAIKQALKGETPSHSQQQAIDNMKDRMSALIQGELTWEKLEPMYVSLYKESFSEEEVAGMLSFYKTPAGQAVIYKLPVLTQKTMLEIQKIISGVTPQMQKIQKDFLAEMKAASK